MQKAASKLSFSAPRPKKLFLDNWNIQNVSTTVNGSSGSACLYNHGGNPLVRLTGSAPSVTLRPGTGC